MLDTKRLAKLRTANGKLIARCPACAESGGDAGGTHLAIFPDGRFACVTHQGDKDHRRRIWELAGLPDEEPEVRAMAVKSPPEKADLVKWPGDCAKLVSNSETLQRLATWRGWTVEFCTAMARAGVIGLHEGRICFPVSDPKSGAVIGRHVFGWPGADKLKAWYAPGKNLPLIIGAESLADIKAAHVLESQWDVIALLHARGWTGDALKAPFIVTRGTSVNPLLRDALAGVQTVTLWPQRDESKADGQLPPSEEWLSRCLALMPESVKEAKRADVPPPFKDWGDVLRERGPAATLELVKAATRATAKLDIPPPQLPTASVIAEPQPEVAADSEPMPLPSSIPVPAFNVDRLLPHSLRSYVEDCAERLQVDASFIAVPLLVSLGAVMGNRLGLRPKLSDDWTEFPNLWGAVVGRPSTLKSPALSAALRFVGKLEAAANEAHKQAVAEWKQTAAAADVRRTAARAKATSAAKKGEDFDAAELVAGDDDDGPACRRFITNDATPEALHSILSREVNATGVMVFADELSGLLARLNDAERGGALRAFMLSAWSGHLSAVVDRVGRGENLRVDRCCVSVLGGIQPGKIAPLVDGAVRESIEDDGWLQRLSLLVWPDAPADFKVVDRLPDGAAFAEVMDIFERAERTSGANWPGAKYDELRGDWFVRLEPSAVDTFKDWLEQETKSLRTDDIGAALESHFIKYRKLVCGLALLFHVASEPDEESVSLGSLVRALQWVDYLKAHARRVYGSGRNATASTAARILERLRRGDLPARFKARDVKRPAWSGLTDGEAVDAALAMLEEFGWLSVEELKPATGRPTKEFIAHPCIFKT